MKLNERITTYLEKMNREVDRKDLFLKAKQEGYTNEKVYDALKVITETHANIGQWQDQKTKVNYLRWYPPTDLTNKVQECLDRGDDW